MPLYKNPRIFKNYYPGAEVKFRYLPILILILLIISLISCKNQTVQSEEVLIEEDGEVTGEEQEEEKTVAKETTPAIKITDVSWHDKIIEITFNRFPS
ncbi:MAG: hypothetical protein GH151_11790 [Bacteroidetes bacterium]|nr:hypothetical protein [Bacteroidota bacterium]